VHLLDLSQTHPPTSRLFFPLAIFFSSFSGVYRQEEFKNTTNTLLQKVHVEKQFQKNPQKFRSQFFLDFFLFIAVSGVSQGDGSLKTLQKTFYKKNVSEKKSQKNRPKIQNRLVLGFLLSRFWAFLGEGSSKTKPGKKTDPGPFLASGPDPPTHHGGRRFVLGGPLHLAYHSS
jgi:hypothetical protein